MIGTRVEIIEKLKMTPGNKKYELKESREKRSLNANSYAWVMMTKIADKLRLSKEDVYFQMLKDYGQSQMVSVLSGIDVKDYFKYYAEAGKSMLNGKEFTHYKVYKGSSEYDTKEMSILIDGILQECRELEIETKSDEEIKSLVENWK